ncbi:MAG: cobalt-precorrin-5B (C(1))-methyltransferase CbiD [Deferribacterales bacterium]
MLILRSGYTTGSTACAAACASCVYILKNILPQQVNITLPGGQTATIPIHMDDSGIYAVKDGGDDIDATHGMKIYADVTLNDSGEITVTGGKGIGTVTRKGLQIPVGHSAINPVPLKMIKENLRTILNGRGADVIISAPEGEEIARQTFNEKVGITGGISIIGTTGIVTPMSVEAIIETIKCEIDVASAEGHKKICLTPGKIGENNFTSEYKDIPVIMMSNFTGEAFEYAREKGFSEIFAAGHPSKLCKILMGYYNTHSKNSPQSAGFIAERLGLAGSFNTVEEILEQENTDLSFLALELAERLEKDFGFAHVSVIFYDMKGRKKGERF